MMHGGITSKNTKHIATQRLSSLLTHLSSPNIRMSFFSKLPEAPADGILQLSVLSKADHSPQKVDLGVGAYRDNHGKPWVLPTVKDAQQKLLETPSFNHEYLPVGGLPSLTLGAQRLIFGSNSPAIQDGRVYTIQTISGTGANMVGAVFLKQFVQDSPAIYISKPTWGK